MKSSDPNVVSAPQTPKVIDERKRKLLSVLFGVASLCSGAVVGALFVSLSGGKGSFHHLSLVAVGASLLLGFFLALVSHEAGHLTAGLLVGFQCELFQIGPLRFQRDSIGKFSFRFGSSGGAIGICRMLPQTEVDLVQKFSLTILGGPLANVTLGSMALSLHLLLRKDTFANQLAVSFGLLSLGLALVCLLPSPSKSFLTDGARWLRLRRGGPLAERDVALLRLVTMQSTGVPASQWPESLFEKMTALEDDSIFEAFLYLFHYYRSIDRQEVGVASFDIEQAQRILQTKHRFFKDWIFAEHSWFRFWYFNECQEELEAASNSRIVDNSLLRRCKISLAVKTLDKVEAKLLMEDAFNQTKNIPKNFWELARLYEMKKALECHVD